MVDSLTSDKNIPRHEIRSQKDVKAEEQDKPGKYCIWWAKSKTGIKKDRVLAFFHES